MSNYSRITNFTAKDSLPEGDAEKLVVGSELQAEFDAISVAIATKAESAGGSGSYLLASAGPGAPVDVLADYTTVFSATVPADTLTEDTSDTPVVRIKANFAFGNSDADTLNCRLIDTETDEVLGEIEGAQQIGGSGGFIGTVEFTFRFADDGSVDRAAFGRMEMATGSSSIYIDFDNDGDVPVIAADADIGLALQFFSADAVAQADITILYAVAEIIRPSS